MTAVREDAAALDHARALTRRVHIGALYTNGRDHAEVVKTDALGHIHLRDLRTGQRFGRGIHAFRRDWWRVR